MPSLLERHAARHEALQSERDNANPTIANEYNNLWGGTGRKIELLDPNTIELFKDADGEKQPDHMQEEKVLAIMASAEDIGFLQPAIVRLMPDGSKQMLSGRHRREAAIRLHQMLPCEIRRNISDTEAYKIMAETNTPNGEQYPSEQGQIYKAYLDMRTSGGEEKTTKEIAAKFNVSQKTIYRYIRLLDLPDKLRHAVDMKIIPIGKFETLLGGLSQEQLTVLGDYIDYYDVKHITSKDIKKLLLVSERDDWDLDLIWKVLNEDMWAAPAEQCSSSNEADNAADGPLPDNNVLISTIRQKYPAVSGISDNEICELVLSLLADYFL